MGPAAYRSNAVAGAHHKPASRRNRVVFVKPGAFIDLQHLMDIFFVCNWVYYTSSLIALLHRLTN